jgi:hypothetical protein
MPASTSWCRTLATHLGHLTMTPTNPNCGAADAMRWLLKRELFYTAVTRAKAKIGVVGSESSVRAAVERRCIDAIVRALAVVGARRGWTSGWSVTTACTTRFKPSLTNTTAMEHNPMGSDGRWPHDESIKPLRCTCTGRVAHVLHFRV